MIKNQDVFTKENLIKWYTKEKRKIKDIAKEGDGKVHTVERYLKKHKIPRGNRRVSKLYIAPAIGTQFNKWIFLAEIYDDPRGFQAWKMQCTCEAKTIRVTSAGAVTKGLSKSCGCLAQELIVKLHRISDTYITTGMWGKILEMASKRSIAVEITPKYISDLLEQQNFCCALSGEPFQLAPGNMMTRNKHNCSLDRIDSKKPYIEGNVQWVLTKINMMKQSYSQAEFIDVCKKVCKFNS